MRFSVTESNVANCRQTSLANIDSFREYGHVPSPEAKRFSVNRVQMSPGVEPNASQVAKQRRLSDRGANVLKLASQDRQENGCKIWRNSTLFFHFEIH
ncbi:hypothetical protein AVEN_93363-1 [Araneus ventricosus]|uniref:Uncharacterized protein n=1 Tax=Araneus ventricosus TaxID=182803 RepID=A0A4Y2QX51_ARAVE|nr:hypothetical protein AVEN_93363-1 [Araneus ventricosus]